ncbi:MAG: hypothetical protein ACM359_01305 [Bacillota bacterium]
MQKALFERQHRPPVIVACGVGRDSVAMLVEMHNRRWRPDAILFANTGSEKADTYRYIPVLQAWLKAHDFPPLTVVRYEPVTAPYRSLEGNAILNATLVSAAFNKGGCTHKTKIEPQNKWSKRWEPALRAWAEGQKVIKLIGFECDEMYRLKRADAQSHSGSTKWEREHFEPHCPLIEWGYNLEKCKQIITDAGLPLPVKSACYFCPNQKPAEVDALTDDERGKIILQEVVAEPYNLDWRGLWRKKSIAEYILKRGLTFTPLTVFGKKVVLNPACKKAREGYTLNPPHVGPSLRQLLTEAGHEVPEVVLNADGETDIYREEYRHEDRYDGCGAACDLETDQHMALVESL